MGVKRGKERRNDAVGSWWKKKRRLWWWQETFAGRSRRAERRSVEYW